MSKKSKWRKDCGVNNKDNCFNCKYKIIIKETKDEIIVTCNPFGLNRTLKFSRKTSPDPFCGSHDSNLNK